jgi:hypothetical protein
MSFFWVIAHKVADVRGGSIGRMRALPYDERSDYYYDIHPITESHYWVSEIPLAGDTEYNLVHS